MDLIYIFSIWLLPVLIAITFHEAALGYVPCVYQTGADPVAAGLVTSLSRPGGNLTGSSTSRPPKQLGLSMPNTLIGRADELIE